MILSGDTLINALKPEISGQLMKIASFCESVLCCRVSPKQKQEVVSLVRKEVFIEFIILLLFFIIFNII